MLNTELFRFYCEFDKRFHTLAIFIKWWVAQKTEALEFKKNFKLNSFSLICMLIVYLQDVEYPPILPKIITTNDAGLNLDTDWDFETAQKQLKAENTEPINELFK